MKVGDYLSNKRSMKTIKRLIDIDTTNAEGQMLLAALSVLSDIDKYAGLTIDEIVTELADLVSIIYP